MAKLYIDGEVIGEAEIPGALKSIDDPLRIAQDCDRPNNVFTGIIDEVRLWNRALSQDDINIAKDLSAQATPVDPLGKLSTTWGNLKSRF
ncbi:LamG domain-containing protein [Candidatus Poribacteria bacterium]|nr:LamG domain-containing protein [Candidatus Poribacteria bacterium]